MVLNELENWQMMNKYKKAGSFFWETVTTKRSLAFGGNSRREFFPGVTASSDFVNDVEGPESCNTYNMLKLTEDLFRENPLAKYADYYERPCTIIYFQPNIRRMVAMYILHRHVPVITGFTQRLMKQCGAV